MNTITWTGESVQITDENGITWHSQPNWPDMTPWASEQEAIQWAQSLLDWYYDQQLPEEERAGIEPPKDMP